MDDTHPPDEAASAGANGGANLSDDRLSGLRAYAFSIAYRMLGSVQDAEDAVQDVYLRLVRAPDQPIDSPRAYIATLVTRVCIDRLRVAARARKRYVGPWLPEPLVAQGGDPAETDVDAETLSLAFLVVLEALTPVERAVFLLHEVFGYEHAEIAAMVRRSEVNVRQIAHRARRAVAARRPKFRIPPERRREIGGRFVEALRRLDLEAMMSLMTSDVTLRTDGGGKARAARRPIVGAERIIRFLIGIAAPEFVVGEISINGQPGLVATVDGEVIAAVGYDVADDRIKEIFIITNPEKLSGIRREPDARAHPVTSRLRPSSPER